MRKKNPISFWMMAGAGVAILMVVLLLTRATAKVDNNVVEINLTAQNAEMYVGEEKPVFTAEISCTGDTNVVLDEEIDYTIQDLVDELENGVGYTLESDGDGSEVGEFQIMPELTSAVSTPLNTDWIDKVSINLNNGSFRVKEIDEEHKAELEAQYNQPMIALTFDDGPGKYTMELLNILEEYDAHATFFMLGSNVPKYGDTVARMKEIGCELGNHSYDHPQLPKLAPEQIREQVDNTNQAINEAAGSPASVLRPPYGATDDIVKENVEMPMVLWSIDTLDWKTKDANATVEQVLNNVEDGDIVLMHDIYEQSVDAAIRLIPELQERGYKLVTVSELAKARGKTMEKGEKYFGFWK